jgi:hypothetical protein
MIELSEPMQKEPLGKKQWVDSIPLTCSIPLISDSPINYNIMVGTIESHLLVPAMQWQSLPMWDIQGNINP